MTKKKVRATVQPGAHRKQRSGGAPSLAIPIFVGLVVVGLIIYAILTIEKRQPAASASNAAGVPTLSVPIVTAQPRPTNTLPYPDVKRTSVQEAKDKAEKGQALLVDVRARDFFDQLHVTGALALPEEEVDARLQELPRDKEIILYCT